MLTPLAYSPDGDPVTTAEGLPDLSFPKLVRVADDALHVDGWRFPISTAPDPIVWSYCSD